MAARTSTKSTRTAEQQAALDAMRAKRASAADIEPKNEAPTVEVLEATEDAETQGIMARLNAAIDEMYAKTGVSSWKRYIAAMLTSMVTSFSIGYVGGFLSMLAYAVLMLSGHAFLAWVVAIIGILLTMVIGVRAGKAAYDYIALKQIDTHASVCWGFVKAVFNVGGDKKPAAPTVVAA